jgi:hypothetical protein
VIAGVICAALNGGREPSNKKPALEGGLMSGFPRGISNLGGLIFPDNLVPRQAKSDRFSQWRSHVRAPVAGPTDPNEDACLKLIFSGS